MKRHQNRLDRFSVIAKQLVDEHSEQYFNECKRETDPFGRYNDHVETLGEQLERKASEFLQAHKTGCEELKNDIWSACTKYLDLFIEWNQPGRINQFT